MSKIEQDDLLQFAEANIADPSFVGVLQVGSSARGHALPGSDIDMMAFYDSEGRIKSRPNHTSLNGTPVTLEHHDIGSFIENTEDYRFNLASLRQLHKIRDAVVLRGSDELSFLIKHAENAHIDKTVPLMYLERVAAQWPMLESLSDAESAQMLGLWVEVAATLYAVSTPRNAAYSKPKWLYRTLRGAECQDAINLLDQVYVPSAERVAELEEAFQLLVGTYDWQTADEFFKRLLKTAVNDTQEMFTHLPEESFASLRFTASQFCRAFLGVNPYEMVLSNEELPEPFRTILSPNPAVPVADIKNNALLFLKRIYQNIRQDIQSNMGAEIGTNRFFTHVLDLYSLEAILPASTLKTKLDNIATLDAFFEIDPSEDHPETQIKSTFSGAASIQNRQRADYPISGKGKLIVICGIDGSGKTTQEQTVVETLRSYKIPFHVTKQPTDWYRKNPIVRRFLNDGHADCSIDTIALLAASDRMLQIENEIQPRLDAGEWVVCNRYVYSTYGYFMARGADMEFVEGLNAKVPEPNYGIFLEIDPHEAIRRILERDGDKRKFEEKSADYLAAVQTEMLSRWPSQFLRLDASCSQEGLRSQVRAYVEEAVAEVGAQMDNESARQMGRNDRDMNGPS